MTRQERRAGIVLILLSIFVIIYVLIKLRIGNLSQPGPGFFPIISGIGILFLSTLWLLTNRKSSFKSEPLWKEGQLKGPLIAIIIITIYAILIDILGYITSTVIFLAAWQTIIAHEKWKRIVVIAVIGTFAMYLLFNQLLAVPLPSGLLI